MMWKSRSKRLFMMANVMLPLLAGACIYIISSPNVVFVRWLNLPANTASALAGSGSWWWLILRYYFLDMLWGYSLVFAVNLVMDNAAAWKLFLLTFVFAASVEISQLLPVIQGTFDLLDILVEGIAEMLAVVIIKIMRRS